MTRHALWVVIVSVCILTRSAVEAKPEDTTRGGELGSILAARKLAECSDVAGAYGQCGGSVAACQSAQCQDRPWDGTCCPDSYQCTRSPRDPYWNCLPSPGSFPPASLPSLQQGAAFAMPFCSTLEPDWGQCGGTAGRCKQDLCNDAKWLGSCCSTGWACTRIEARYWQCLLDKTLQSPRPASPPRKALAPRLAPSPASGPSLVGGATCVAGAENCTRCDAFGRLCSYCDPGFALQDGECLPCIGLTYSPGGSNPLCRSCRAGGAQCAACDPATGACLSCRPGYKEYYSVLETITDCIACGPGFYPGPSSGANACQACPDRCPTTCSPLNGDCPPSNSSSISAGPKA